MEEQKEHQVTAEEVVEAYHAMEKAQTNYWYLKALRDKQRNPNTFPSSISDIMKEMPKKSQYMPPPNAVRIDVEPGLVRYDEGARVMDIYTDKSGIVWELPWNKTTTPLSAQQRKKFDDILKKYEKYEWKDAAMIEVKCPCATGGCAGYTYKTIANLRDIAEDDYQREIIKFLFCDSCLAGEKYVNPFIKKWQEICPVMFQTGDTKTDIKKLPQWSYGKIKEWGENIRFSNKSLYVVGETGTCKSRMMYQLLYHCVAKNGYTFKVFNGGDYRNEQNEIYSTRYDKKPQNRISSEASTVDVLVFDDFGQDELSPTMMSDLWNLIDDRLSNGKRTIFLSNFAPDDLKARYGHIFSMDSMVRRLEEFCKIIDMGVDPQIKQWKQEKEKKMKK